MPSTGKNRLYYGDNLTILREQFTAESVDLIYLDPPFNSNRSYNVLFKNKTGKEAQAQIEAFDDTWTWSHESEMLYIELITGGAPLAVADGLTAMRKMMGTNDVLAYLVMMTARLVEMHRVLRPDGQLFLHCDPTASHYLKIMLDAIFGPTRFLNEIIWHYQTSGGAPKKTLVRNHDTIFRYCKTSAKTVTWNQPLEPWPEATLKKWQKDEEGRIYHIHNDTGKRYYINPGGKLMDDVWDITLAARSRERLGYPTQKPLALLNRIVAAASNPGDVVLDPFCGCGTTIDAAQSLGRKWLGIDITYLAIDLIDKRLRHAHGDEIAATYETVGTPRDTEGARALFASNPFDFERWAVSLLGAQPNDRQVGDRGIDGVGRFPIDNTGNVESVLVSVKGGKQLNPAMLRDLIGTVQAHRAGMGVFICLTEPTPGIKDAARHPASTHTRYRAPHIPRSRSSPWTNCSPGRCRICRRWTGRTSRPGAMRRISLRCLPDRRQPRRLPCWHVTPPRHDVPVAGWRPWRVLRERADIDFALVDLPVGLRAVCAARDGDRVILIDRQLPPVERLAALAHELVHLERGGGCHEPGLPAPLRTLVAREEARVDTIVAMRLVPRDQLAAFIDLRAPEGITADVVAEEFDVPPIVARRALELLRSSLLAGAS